MQAPERQARSLAEREVDAMLTRKMQRRAGSPFRGMTLAGVPECVQAFLSAHLDGSFPIRQPCWFCWRVENPDGLCA